MATELPDQSSNMGEFDIVNTYLKFLKEDPEISKPIAAIESLVELIETKQPSTQAELINLLDIATTTLKTKISNSISLSAGCDLFSRFVLRNLPLYSDWENCKKHLVENGQLFLRRSKEARFKIAKTGFNFIKDDDCILIHGFSRVIYQLLQHAADNHIRFRIVLTESKPSSEGVKFIKLLKQRNIPTTLIYDSCVGYIINKVDTVLVGAEGVAESGGIINHIGTFQISLLAKSFNKPVYVAAESYKFVRLYPLGPDDLKIDVSPLNFNTEVSSDEEEESEMADNCPKLDFTPHEYITALITDLGVLTPAAVSEELIKMWYD
ncbi:translation initiation factor eIF2B subunit alpha [Saccharomycopsis crataegensis]|uniref:Translation initiation factor eIF2B subunit alpha n=1 Tax=Saccharomycopsis crataegensis TaxID=43959 RepID=A0AAV5QVN3_9ASCO|nr:translation initiation factor eIF2B subunit alpha [Saccharomycopsis crataegensis]